MCLCPAARGVTVCDILRAKGFDSASLSAYSFPTDRSTYFLPSINRGTAKITPPRPTPMATLRGEKNWLMLMVLLFGMERIEILLISAEKERTME